MKLFLDTSALVKLFHRESGTTKMESLISEKNNEIWVLSLSRLEFSNALYRRFRNREIDEKQLMSALQGFADQLHYFNEEPLGPSILSEAEHLLSLFGKTQGLRTLDSLQLGAFSLLKESDWMFVSADDRLNRIASEMGFVALDPTI